jgi:hypothetical protein
MSHITDHSWPFGLLGLSTSSITLSHPMASDRNGTVSGVLPTRRVGAGAAAAIAGVGAIGWGTGNCGTGSTGNWGATGCTNGGSSGSWMTSPYSSCSSRTGTSCPCCSGNGSSGVLLHGVSVLSDPAWSEGSRNWIKAGELAAVAVANGAVTNGEIVGSATNDEAPDVSTVRVGTGVATLGNLRRLSSDSSSRVSSPTGFLRYA